MEETNFDAFPRTGFNSALLVEQKIRSPVDQILDVPVPQTKEQLQDAEDSVSNRIQSQGGGGACLQGFLSGQGAEQITEIQLELRRWWRRTISTFLLGQCSTRASQRLTTCQRCLSTP